jgi:RimJ/RimL family protein N-acetyltransferase
MASGQALDQISGGPANLTATGVQLLPAKTKHTQFIYDLYSDPQVMKGHGHHKPIPGPHWRNIIQGLYDGWKHIYILAIGSAYVGHAGFQDHSPEDKRAEIAITVLPSMQRRGIAHDALNEMLDLGFDSVSKGGLGLDCIWAGVHSENEPARRLFEKCGFRAVGEIPEFFRLEHRKVGRVFYYIDP